MIGTGSTGAAAGAALVEYLVARDGLPPRRGLAYDYVLGGDGVFLAAEGSHLAVRVPVARCSIRGLPPVYAACTLKHERLPVSLWEEVVRLARVMGALGREVVFTATHTGAADQSGPAGYRLLLPDQVAGALRVHYRPPSGAVLELHSHHRLPARFSATDDADEQRLCLYGVVGRLDRGRIEVALRVGAYGHFLPLPWESVFAGTAEDRAGVHDAHFDGAYPADASAGTVRSGTPEGAEGGDTDEHVHQEEHGGRGRSGTADGETHGHSHRRLWPELPD